MGIDAKETGAMLLKILGFSMNTSIKFMRNHPIISSVSMFLLVLYIFLPSLLFFLIYSSPVLACGIVYAREKLGLRFSGESCGGGEKNGGAKCHLRQQRSVRRNARMKVEEWDSTTSEGEDDKVILTSLYNDLLGRTPHFEESPKAIETVVEEEDEKAEDLGVSSRDLDGEKEPMVCNCEINEEKYRGFDGKEETKEEVSNVNEYGISEIERNMRLESLIARRRARRLFRLALDQRSKLQADETTSPRQNNNNLQVMVPRSKNNSNLFEKHRDFSSDGTVMGLQVPGSAPSVMSQGRNPFDIPYDPQEERPILTGDSFDQEFSLFNTKDMFFCRHESFCRFSLFSQEPSQCMNSPASAADIATTRKRLDLDNEYMDHSEQKLPCEDKEATIENDNRSVESEKNGGKEVEMNEETDSNPEEDDDSSCSDESESELSRLNKAELREAICHSMDNYPGYLVNQTRNSIPNPLPRAAVAPRLDDNDMFYARKCANSHSRTFSIASDMQVEVSEIGSPPTTVDWPDDCSNAGESYMYDTDIDREIVKSEESRKRLSDQNESRSGIGLKEETKPVATPDQRHVVDEHLRELDDTSLLDRNSQTKEDTELVPGEIFEQRPSSSSEVYKRSNSGKFGGLLFHTSESLCSITEEPETVLESVDGGISENMNYLTEESSDQRSLISPDSPIEKLVDEEVIVKQNDDLCGSPKMIDLDIYNNQQWNNVLGEDDTEIDMKKYENTKVGEYEATQSLLDASLDTPCTEPFEREIKEEEQPNIDNFSEEKTKQPETEVLQCDLNVLTELLESEETEEKLVEKIDEEAEPIEQDTSQIVLEGLPSDPHTHITEDCIDTENARNVSYLQVGEGNSSTLDESTDQEISKEGGESSLIKDLHAELIQEDNNKTNAEEESVVSADHENSQDAQPWIQQFGTNSSEGTSPRILETTQQQEHEDVIAPNTVFQEIAKDESIALESAGAKYNDEENLKHDEQSGEAMERKPELDVEPMHHNIALVAREDDEESMTVVKAMPVAESETMKDENKVSEKLTHE